MATCLKLSVLLLLLTSVLAAIRVPEDEPTARDQDSGEESDIDLLLRQLASQTSHQVPNDVNEAMTLLSLLISMHRHRKLADDVRQRVRPVTQNDVRLSKRQRQCFWSVVTCY